AKLNSRSATFTNAHDGPAPARQIECIASSGHATRERNYKPRRGLLQHRPPQCKAPLVKFPASDRMEIHNSCRQPKSRQPLLCPSPSINSNLKSATTRPMGRVSFIMPITSSTLSYRE